MLGAVGACLITPTELISLAGPKFLLDHTTEIDGCRLDLSGKLHKAIRQTRILESGLAQPYLSMLSNTMS